jgi:hypothetical protein
VRDDKERGDKEKDDKEKGELESVVELKLILLKINRLLVIKKTPLFRGVFLCFVKCFHLALFALQIKFQPGSIDVDYSLF